MDNLKDSFEDVADWCEKHLEKRRGREIGMIFGAMLRAYGRLATPPSRLHGEGRVARERELNDRAEGFLLELSARSLEVPGPVETTTYVYEETFRRTNMTYDTGQKRRLVVEPSCMVTNMVYDPGPRPKP
jgi:hypothetical protein